MSPEHDRDEPEVILRNTPEQRAAARRAAEARRERATAPGHGEGGALRERVLRALRTVRDPEIPVDIWELGLVYDLDVDDLTGEVGVRMTLTSPSCPVAEAIPAEVARAVEAVAGVSRARVDLVWEPPWTRDMMTDAARLQLGML